MTSLAIGQLDDSYESDLAAAAGNQVLMFHGRDRRLTQGSIRKFEVQSSMVDSIDFQTPLLSVAVGNFVGDNGSEIAVSDATGALKVMERNGSRWANINVGAGEVFTTLFAANIAGGPHESLLALDGHGQIQALSSTGSALTMARQPASDSSFITGLSMLLNRDGLQDLVLLRKDSPDPVLLVSTPAAAFTVNSTLDAADATINGICNDGAGHCTLRAAIQEANAVAAASTISFNIAGAGPFTIAPATALPVIVRPILIDGTTQPGVVIGSWPPSLLIELNAAGTGGVGFQIDSGGGGSFITGLVINGAPTRGILINSSNFNIVRYNFIGTDVSGTIAVPNHGDGIRITGGSDHNTIGGVSDVQRNLISGNNGGNAGVDVISGPTNTFIQGNYIGTDLTGSVALPNVVIANIVVAFNVTGTVIGGAPNGRNIISAGSQFGMTLQGTGATVPDVTGTIVAGNYIGLDATGTAALGNASVGVNIRQCQLEYPGRHHCCRAECDFRQQFNV